MKKIRFKYDVVSHVGAVRTNNEDMAYIFGAKVRDDSSRSMVVADDSTRFAALIADGMGGYGGGEIASEMVVDSFDTFLQSLSNGLDTLEVIMATKNWATEINAELIKRSRTDQALANMGTTLTGIFTYGTESFLINAGDSRVYRFRDGNLYQLSTDHSERNRRNDPTIPSNLIYNAFGINEAFLDITAIDGKWPMLDGDRYLICSDGLNDMLPDDKIAAILENNGSAQTLVDAAIEAGGRDNVTVTILQISMIIDEQPEIAAPELTIVNEDTLSEIHEDKLQDETVIELPDVPRDERREISLPPLPTVPPLPTTPPEVMPEKANENCQKTEQNGARELPPPVPEVEDVRKQEKLSFIQRCRNAIEAFRSDN